MKLTMEKIRRIGCFLAPFFLIYYIFMNSARKIMIPFSEVTVPVMLILVFFLAALCARGGIRIRGCTDMVQCFSWLAIAVMISTYNGNYILSLQKGGLVQFYVMVSFMFFSGNMGKTWVKYWILFTELFSLLCALVTILFYLNENLYVSYVHTFFNASQAEVSLAYYSRGWMAGWCTHFSTNGILLSTGVMLTFFSLQYVSKQKNHRFLGMQSLFYVVSGLLELYALILSSKRAPLFAAVFAIAVVYVIAKRRNIIKRLVMLAILVVIFYVMYEFLLPYIPGLSTIADKTDELMLKDAGVLNGRMGLWKRAVEMFLSSPLIGHGFGSYVGYAVATNAITTSAHNYYLQLLAEYGIFGTALYITAFAASMIQTVSVMMKYGANLTRKDLLYLSFSLALQVFTLVYNMSSTALMYYHILIPLFLSYSATRTVRYSYENENNPAALTPHMI